ncbi:MAG: hypothetical protein AAEC10_06585, partial [Rhodospirillales bacterium]
FSKRTAPVVASIMIPAVAIVPIAAAGRAKRTARSAETAIMHLAATAGGVKLKHRFFIVYP